MKKDNKKYGMDIKDIVKTINNDIICSYEILKNEDFYRAWKYDDSYIGMSGDEDGNCFKEFFMKNGKFNFRFRTTSYADDYRYENYREKAVNYLNKNGKSFNKSRRIFDRIRFNIFKGKDNYIEKLWVIKTGDFSSIDEFADYCFNNYGTDETYIKGILDILSNLPAEMEDACKHYKEKMEENEDYMEEIETSEDKKHKKFTDGLKKNLDGFKNSIDYINLYYTNPEFFLERVNSLPDEEKELVFGELAKDETYMVRREIDQILSEKYPHLIAAAFRKRIKKNKP